ncbi:MAG: heparin lyase I family protein [Anaerolineales bacterium]|nr:heparin lyase I family protein [Anaerolineales bacterium]
MKNRKFFTMFAIGLLVIPLAVFVVVMVQLSQGKNIGSTKFDVVDTIDLTEFFEEAQVDQSQVTKSDPVNLETGTQTPEPLVTQPEEIAGSSATTQIPDQGDSSPTLQNISLTKTLQEVKDDNLPVNTSTSTFTVVPKLDATITPKPVNSLVPTELPPQKPTLKPSSTVTPKPTKTSTPLAEPDVVWYESFETGDFSELDDDGEFTNQGGGTYQFVNKPARSGNLAMGLSIDTNQVSDTDAYAASIAIWRDFPEASYYYSTWFYIPSEIEPESWWNIFEWLVPENRNHDAYPTYGLLPEERNGKLYLVLSWRPDHDTLKEFWYQNIKSIPRDKWFQIEAFYYETTDTSGGVVIWQDGTEIFNVTGFPTGVSDAPIYFIVSNYAESMSPHPATIYIDDMIISRTRIGTYSPVK